MPDIKNAQLLLKKYKAARSELTNRITQNEQWYNMRHMQGLSGERRMPASAWLFNSLAVKHADAMDAIPTPYISAREPSDVESAEALSKLLPVILDRNDFHNVYSSVWNDKLKHGTGCYGVFWNPEANGMLGEIELKRIDILNLFWECGVSDLENSPNIFHCELRSIDAIKSMYPQCADIEPERESEHMRYLYDRNVDVSDKISVVDWYYKKRREDGSIAVHYCKFAADKVLFSTEDSEEYAQSGLYEHGRYPFITDVMYAVEGTPYGFGSLDIMKDAQLQIDTLNFAILENARMAATRRYFIRADGSVNEQEFADWTKPFVHIQGAGLGQDSIREITVQPLSDIYLDVINNKITELKETSGNRDVTAGGTEGGVTAAAAINALQKSGSKMTEDMIASSYRAFCKVCYLMIELIRQFYTVPRCFRIIGVNGKSEPDYLVYDNSTISGFEGICADGSTHYARKPYFDISVSAEKSVKSKREEGNAMARELYGMGVFAPENRESAKILLSMMDFEGRDELLARLTDRDG